MLIHYITRRAGSDCRVLDLLLNNTRDFNIIFCVSDDKSLNMDTITFFSFGRCLDPK